MKKLISALLLLTIFAFMSYGQPESRQTTPDKVSIGGTVEQPLNVEGHLPVIQAKVNGTGPYRFQLDTGFGGMMQLSDKIAAQLNLSAIGEARSSDPSGRNPVSVRLLHADSVEVGSARMSGVTVSESKRQMPNGVDGVIGLNLFNKLIIRLDYVNNKFLLSQGSLAPNGSLMYTTEHGVPTVEILVNGAKTRVDIDSGSPGQVTLPLSMAKALPLRSEPSVVGRGRTVGGEFEVYGAEMKGEVSVGGVILKDPRIDFISIFPIGNLGFRFLESLSVTFDPANKRVRFEKAGESAAADDLSSLAKTEVGKRAMSYFPAFNSGDDAKLAAFFAENTDADALKRRPVEPRVAFHKQVRGDFKQLEPKKLVSTGPEEIQILAESPSGTWASLTFEIEPSGKFAGVSVQMADAPSNEPAPKAPSTMAELSPAVDSMISDLAKKGRFSGVVMIAKDERPVFAKAYGFANAERKLENNVETRFNLGSINKLITRIAIGQLVKQGKLSFSDKLIKVLPDYPNRDIASKVTIGQIVTMTSGLGDFFNEKFDAADKSKIRGLKDYLPFFVDQPLLFEPGSGNSYSNAGYLVLGLVIEKLSGKDYYEYVRENIFKPTGMSNSDWFANDALPANTATGYTMNGGKPAPNVGMQPARGSSAGGGYSSAADMLKLSTALRSKKLVVPDDSGSFPDEVSATGVAGGSPGVNAIFFVMPRLGYTIVVLSNLDPPSAEKPGSQIRSWLERIQ